ncbi:PAS domain S-box protein [Gilvimarinus sp. SDUM040013]|uniref:histidine kinase n=1 Tax=Gilvimarinus gilvus TaxID=3058038 RepID=A0ABU4S0J0_9GAMM|nr:PAS domain-containing sensor histidine kinase [Gilvimarinus sp. SDUM040013]MDO3384896.1 PAS domain S-box protein [Gilvimarinus sp. SDUM040013]MDX6850679.1 PAS domain S-box protein [Gilvimarinus sp. SDUM040013]
MKDNTPAITHFPAAADVSTGLEWIQWKVDEAAAVAGNCASVFFYRHNDCALEPLAYSGLDSEDLCLECLLAANAQAQSSLRAVCVEWTHTTAAASPLYYHALPLFDTNAGDAMVGVWGIVSSATFLAGDYCTERILCRAGHEVGHESELIALRRGNAQLTRQLENSPLGAIELDHARKITAWNPAAARIFAISADDAIGANADTLLWAEVTEQERRELFDPRVRHTRRNIYHRLGTGKMIIAEWNITPLGDNGGEGYIALVGDVTRQREALSALARREQEQSDILNAMADAAITINDRGVILTFNQAAVHMFGYQQREAIGKKVNMLMPKGIADAHDGYISNYLQTGQAKVIGLGRELEGLHKNGSHFPLRLSVAELPRSDQGGRRFLGTCHDLTEVKEQERRLFHSQKMEALGKLTGGIAHDFNNILGVIAGYANLLEDEVDEDEPAFRYIREIDRAAERGGKLTKRLLYLSKHRKMETSKVNLGEIVEAMQYVLSRTMTPSITVHLDIDDTGYLANINADFLEDAILNLSINAMHAMEGGGNLWISTRACIEVPESMAKFYDVTPGEYLAISVKDDGCGIPSDILDKVFDPFFSTKGDKGTGLGLSQVYGYMRQMGGFIRLKSKADVGTTFILYIPQLAETVTVAPQAVEVEAAVGGSETILVVDDEKALIETCSKTLQKAGYTVFTANGVAAATTILETQSLDLLLSDVIMPDGNGFDLAELAYKIAPDIKIRLVSGYADVANNTVNEDLAANILHKPYSQIELLNAVRVTLDVD